MPEIIEVRKYADEIRKYLKNKEIISIQIANGRYKKSNGFDGFKELKKTLPIKVKNVKTKGKLTYIELENGNYIVVTLGLSGGWCFQKNDKKIKLSSVYEYYLKNGNKKMVEDYINNSLKHLNVSFDTKDGKLWFYDVLSYGTIRYVKNDDIEKILKKIGDDIMEETTTLSVFTEKIQKKSDKYIGNVLMNQQLISGIGNYLRADVLYLSKISPFRKVKNLTTKEIEKIFKYCKMLTWSYYDIKMSKKLGYLTKKDTLPEDHNRLFFIYQQDTDIYGNNVIKEELFEGSQKRFIYWVKKIQK